MIIRRPRLRIILKMSQLAAVILGILFLLYELFFTICF
jgi:hypothetical protein